ncbi:sugar phosphate isomerase/epimerase [archaeon]|nr:sugar phosphate isomerase/epimerase [archaeon]
MMPKFGLMINPSVNLIDHMKLIKASGFDFAELTLEPPNALPDKIRQNIKEINKAGDLFSHPLIGHTAWWLDLGTEYSLVRKASVAEFKKAIDVCKYLSIKYMNIHATMYGLYLGKNTKIILDNFSKSLKELMIYGQKKNVKIMLENVTEGKDVNGAYDEHLPIGKGKINFETVVKELKKIKYGGTMTFEVFTSMDDAIESREIIRRMMKNEIERRPKSSKVVFVEEK